MKISELNQKSFLGGAGAAQKSYVLINYEDDNTSKPVTYRASLDELGKAIANNLHLYKETVNGAVTTNVSQGAYVDGTAKQLVTAAEKTKIANAASAGAITAATTGLASTGYVTDAITYAINAFASEDLASAISGFVSTGYVTEATAGFASLGDLNGLTSEGYITNAISGLASTGYVTNAVDGQVLIHESDLNHTYPYLADNNGHVIDVDMISGAASTGAVTAAVNGLASTVTDAISGLASTGYVTSHAGPSMGDIAAEVHSSLTTLHSYIQAIASTKATALVANKASTGAVTAAVNGLASTGYVTNAISGLASTGYVTSAINEFAGGDLVSTIQEATDGLASTGYVDTAVSTATEYINTMVTGLASTGDVTNAISGLASTGYVTNAISDLASTGYVTSTVSTAATRMGNVKYTDSYLKYYDSVGGLNNITPAMINGAASTGYVTSAIGNATAGLASTGYVTSAVANAGGGGFDPAESISCPLGHYTVNGSFALDGATGSLYPVMMMLDSDNYLYVKSSNGNGFCNIGGLITTFDLATVSSLAYISTSDNKPCIRDYNDTFQGFLSTT